MTFVSRVAAAAAFSLTLFGLAAHSTAARAAELESTPIPQPAAATALPMVAPISITLPAVAPAPTPSIASDEVQPDDTVAYPTLAAAVAAQQTAAPDDEQLRCLAGAIYYESKGEPLAGQLAVAQVILNRAESGRFGSTPCSVVTQRGQFSFVRGGRIPAIDADRPSYRVALAVAKVAMTQAWDGDADGALFFHARRVSPRWSKVKVASIGNHVFYR